MNNFPLYTNLSSGISDKDLTAKQKDDFIKKITVMDKEGHELIYALIKVFFLEHESSSPFNALYGAKNIDSNIVFNIADLPLKLRQILHKFAKIHVKKMKEDSKLNKTRV